MVTRAEKIKFCKTTVGLTGTLVWSLEGIIEVVWLMLML
jgi:hypothetical protein